jgi:ribosomal-protein-alanine N-acetyltransferase
MIRIRPLQERDIDFVHQATRKEQWGHTRRDIERCFAYEPTGCFVAENVKQKVGHIFTISYGELGWIGLLIVSPEHRGKGIGTRLMKQATKYLKEKGTKTIGLDAVAEAVPLYERFGFRKAYDSLRFQK